MPSVLPLGEKYVVCLNFKSLTLFPNTSVNTLCIECDTPIKTLFRQTANVFLNVCLGDKFSLNISSLPLTASS